MVLFPVLLYDDGLEEPLRVMLTVNEAQVAIDQQLLPSSKLLMDYITVS